MIFLWVAALLQNCPRESHCKYHLETPNSKVKETQQKLRGFFQGRCLLFVLGCLSKKKSGQIRNKILNLNDIPAPSKGWCLNPKGLLSGTLYHPFGTPWRVQVREFGVKPSFGVTNPLRSLRSPGWSIHFGLATPRWGKQGPRGDFFMGMPTFAMRNI